MRRLIVLFIIILAVIFFLFAPEPLESQTLNNTNSDKAMFLRIDGAIGPASSDYFQRGLDEAVRNKFSFVILQLDTPGGLDKSMRDMIKKILSSPIPIVTYVAPSGARAASAGTYLLYASHIAAMAPGTHLGAASPVQLGGSEDWLPSQKADKKTELQKPEPKTEIKKATHDAEAYLRTLAQLRGRNTDFAAKAVLNASTMTATEAKEKGVIDILAINLPDLLKQLKGKKIQVLDHSVVFHTEKINLKTQEMDWRTSLLAVITDPNIAYVLLLLGFYGLFFELANPGFVLPGVVGIIALLIAFYALQMLPINYAGLGLIFLGIVFMIAEAYMPAFGALGLGGIIAFIVGSVLLMGNEVPGHQIAWSLIFAMALTNAIVFFGIIGFAIKTRRLKIVTGNDALIGLKGIALEDIYLTGQAKVEGEIWQVEVSEMIKKDEALQVIAVDGLVLKVRKINKEK